MRAGKILILPLMLCTFCTKTYANWEKVNLSSNYITTVETTPWGVMAGENDYAPWVGRYNGIYLSKDIGKTWEKVGLEGRGITDIKYINEKLYATTKYVHNGITGAFVSYDRGGTWNHVPPLTFGTTSVDALNNIVAVGGVNHGLWLSFDNGETWEQKIGTGYFGPEIIEIKLSDNVFLATDTNDVYKSIDTGETWNPIEFLSNQKIKHIEIYKDIIWAGTPNNNGLYVSYDRGNTWNQVDSLKAQSIGSMQFISNLNAPMLFAGITNNSNVKSTFLSYDLGKTWKDTDQKTENNYINSLDTAFLYSKPSYLFVATHFDGLHKYEIPETIKAENFLTIPWNSNNKNMTELDLMDSITAFFDHEYPLLGYKYMSENSKTNNTTLNFLGLREPTPTLYYSSHSGVDFGLPYGTEVQASYEGYATYYYCNACGHSIRINHGNNYETIYMHLRDNKLINTTQLPKWVNTGEVIGLVGLSGNTTGPHLHFGVTKDTNENDTFVDDYPNGLVDPFGWQSNLQDPWPNFIWNDVLGSHKGSSSKYLWSFKDSDGQDFYNINSNTETEIINDSNKTISVTTQPYFKPNFKNPQNYLTYIAKTSKLIRAFDNFGTEIYSLTNPYEVLIDLNHININEFIENTIKIYYFSVNTMSWEPLENQIIDLKNKQIRAKTLHFSHFAVFGEKRDTGDFGFSKAKITNTQFTVK